MAPAAKLSRYGRAGTTNCAASIVSNAPTGSTIHENPKIAAESLSKLQFTMFPTNIIAADIVSAVLKLDIDFTINNSFIYAEFKVVVIV